VAIGSSVPGSKGPNWRSRLIIIGLFIYTLGGAYFGYIFVSTAAAILSPPERQGQVVVLAAEAPGAPTPYPTQPDQSAPVIVPPQPAATRGAERVNVLLLGLDERPKESGTPSRSDTLILATLDPDPQTAALVSLPRDLWVTIPRDSGQPVQHKINTAHFFGQYWNQLRGIKEDGGPELAMRTVEHNFGVPVHYYVRIDFKGFERLIDLIGGIEVDVPRNLVDYAYPLENDQGVTTVRFRAGPQRMDGVTALRYARTRNPDDDFGRMARQRQVLLAVRDQALQVNLLPKLPQLWSALNDVVDTDMPLDKILLLANVARTLETDNISTHAIEADMVVWNEPVVGALWPRQDKVAQLMAKVFASPTR
jgi:polyisoprenyl-teichoic acid--peptidoglycan teichoic acid transferase